LLVGLFKKKFSNFAAKIFDLGRIIAIDYGTKRTGVAVTDPGQLIASPMETVLSHELMVFLEKYFIKEDVETLVVGHPIQTDGSDSESMRPLRFFVQAFKKRFPSKRVEWMDERFTSKMAMDAMIAGGMKKSQRRVKGNIDKISASLILQSWMERQNNLNR
jgi:putative Holliday junction resolvase